MTISPLGDSALVISLRGLVDAGLAARVRALATEIERHIPRGVSEVVPAFASVAVFFEPAMDGGFRRLRTELEAIMARAELEVVASEPREIELPVCYGGEYGPDLEAVAAHCGLPVREVVALHTGGDYFVQAIGFVPGFPYLGGLPERLATPRRPTARREVPAGSVGIGGAQTGIYPLVTPGGWNLIGRTPSRLFDPVRAEPAMLRAGDRVRFQSIAAGEFVELATGAAHRGDSDAAEVGRKPGSVGDPGSGIEVVRAGMFTTVQDLGRTGHRSRGVVLSGAMDPFAMRLANLLVGNLESAAGLEFTLVGPELLFRNDTTIALGGADFDGLPRWRPVPIQAGTRLKLGMARSGCRGCLAIAGGIAVPCVLGSRSTYVRGGFGGLAGRPLRAGDFLPVPAIQRLPLGHWRIDERVLPAYSSAPVVRVLRGAHADGLEHVFDAPSFRLTPQADRMGARLHGSLPVRSDGGDMASYPVAPGTVQVPPDGQPIVLLADAQTIGGYPQVAHVISIDLPLVAQLRPGDEIRFREVELDEAHELAVTRERALAMLREGLAQKFA